MRDRTWILIVMLALLCGCGRPQPGSGAANAPAAGASRPAPGTANAPAGGVGKAPAGSANTPAGSASAPARAPANAPSGITSRTAGYRAVPVALPALPAARAHVPAGFRIETAASGLPHVRMMAFSPDGRLFATQTDEGRILVVPVGTGKPYTWASGLDAPHGIAFHEGYLYVADTNAVLRWRYEPGSSRAPGAPQRIAPLPSGRGHFTRTVHFGPDGRMYVSVGSSCNICIESDPRRAAILQFNADGTGRRTYASGLRNAVDFTWDREGGMWATVNETDNMGDNFPPDPLYRIVEGGFYGWPYAHADNRPDPRFGRRRPDLVAKTIPPAFTFTAHSAPLGIAFYYADQFPTHYWGDAFVALHGSWNRSVPSGYRVVRVHFENGRPASASDFVTGFGRGRSAWARPVGIVVGPDGSLFVSDDKGGRIFRVRYVGR